jgi:LuxR family maltose regulon positive regulatory protein
MCFNVAETQTLLNQLLGIQVDPPTAAAVEEKTEGWVTGVRLAALSMRQGADIDARLLEPHVDAQYVMEYLFNEAFSHQPPEIRQYLLATAILDRFCGPLCDAVCAPGGEPFACEVGGWEFIAWLKKENVFLIPLDPEKRWFRFHHLFQKLLFNQLKRHYSIAEINALHTQASVWFAENGLIEEALQHALAGGDITAAMQLIALHGHNLMNDQQYPRLERWLGMFTRDQVEQNPELLIFEAWLNHMQSGGFDLLALTTYIKRLKTLFDKLPVTGSNRTTQIKGHLDALRGMQRYLSADGENALKHLRSACENIPMHHKRARVFANIFQAGANQMIGELETGLSIYHDEIKKSITLRSGYRATYLANLCFVYWIDADLVALQKTAERSLRIAIDSGLPEAEFFSLYFLGIAYYHQNNLEIAEEKLTAIDKNYYFVHPVIYAHSSVALALVYQARGKIEKARKVCETVMKYAIDTNNQDALLIIRAFEADQALLKGDLAVASHRARRLNAKPYLPPYLFCFTPLTLVRIRMAQDTTNSLQQAADLLDQLHDFLVSIHNNRFRIDTLALQALLHDAWGEEPAALESLAQALNLAEPNGFIRLFVDLGPQMADLLKQLIKQNVAVNYIGGILAAFKEDEDRAMQDESDHLSAQSSPLGNQPLVERLTNRELEILNLLGQWLQNKEIAAELFISPLTVKKHLDNIYGKLNVSGRRQAVEQAQNLGILSRHKG